MVNINRLGLGCMGMNRSNERRSIDTIRAALDAGITLFNTGEFYGAGESELVVGEALKGVPRDRYFLSVKFGVLPQPGGGIYGLDVKPFNVKAHLVYSLKRLGLDYVDLYQPARMDESVPVEELTAALADLVKEGYVRHIGLTQIGPETLRRANAVHPVHTAELEYSLAERGVEKETLETARGLGVNVLAFGALAHGLLSDRVLEDAARPHIPTGMFAPENLPANRELVRALKKIAEEKETTVSNLALAWTFAKYPFVSSLIGTTSPAHLNESIEALKLDLTEEDVKRIERAFPAEQVKGAGMRNFVFRDGKMGLA